jgi:hypothetical protein
MTPRRSAAAFVLLASTSLFPNAVQAQCSTDGTGALCIRVLDEVPASATALDEPDAMSSGSAPSPLVGVGDVLPRGEYSIILNADYYGLPPVSDGWVYMRVGGDAYRVDWQTHQVLERVTERTAANF